MAGGGDEQGVAEGWQLGERAAEFADRRAGRDELRSGCQVEAADVKDLGGPLARGEIDEVGVGGVGIFGDGGALPSAARMYSGRLSQGVSGRPAKASA